MHVLKWNVMNDELQPLQTWRYTVDCMGATGTFQCWCMNHCNVCTASDQRHCTNRAGSAWVVSHLVYLNGLFQGLPSHVISRCMWEYDKSNILYIGTCHYIYFGLVFKSNKNDELFSRVAFDHWRWGNHNRSLVFSKKHLVQLEKMIDPIKTIYIQVPKKNTFAMFWKHDWRRSSRGNTACGCWSMTTHPTHPRTLHCTPTDAVSFEAPLDGWPAVRGEAR